MPEAAAAPATFALRGSAPNPFRVSATLGIDVPVGSSVTLTIFSVTGRRVRGLVDSTLPPGRHAVTWDGRDDAGRMVASGRYFVRLRAGGFEATRTLSVLR